MERWKIINHNEESMIGFDSQSTVELQLYKITSLFGLNMTP